MAATDWGGAGMLSASLRIEPVSSASSDRTLEILRSFLLCLSFLGSIPAHLSIVMAIMNTSTTAQSAVTASVSR